MGWFYFWVQHQAKVAKDNGYFNCPACERRQPCTLAQTEARARLYGIIPLSGGQAVGPESYQCLACGREFVADGSYGFDFGPNAETQKWRCFKCKKEVPYEDFECPHCGFRLEIGGR
jgi:DNA-directed RNA polymerase subunit RPC12/RpoP